MIAKTLQEKKPYALKSNIPSHLTFQLEFHSGDYLSVENMLIKAKTNKTKKPQYMNDYK